MISTLAGLTLLHAAEPSPHASYGLPQGTNEFSLWAGGSPDSFGNIEDRQVLLVGLRYGRVLAVGYGSLLSTRWMFFPQR